MNHCPKCNGILWNVNNEYKKCDKHGIIQINTKEGWILSDNYRFNIHFQTN